MRSFAFDALEVRNGQSLIYPAPKEGAQQPALLSPEGTYEEVTKLQLSSSGAMRLKVPKVTSEEQLKVEIRGLATDALEVTATDEVEISIVYSCLSAGVIGVELALEQAVLSAAHAPEVLHLHWRKHCGDSVYRYLDVFLKENNNRTQVVSKGRTLPGFVRCPKQAAEPGAVDGTKPIIKTECSADPAVEIGPKDLRPRSNFGWIRKEILFFHPCSRNPICPSIGRSSGLTSCSQAWRPFDHRNPCPRPACRGHRAPTWWFDIPVIGPV